LRKFSDNTYIEKYIKVKQEKSSTG